MRCAGFTVCSQPVGVAMGSGPPQATYPFSPPLGPLDDPKKLVCCYVISWARNRADRLHVGMDLCFILEANKCLGKLVAMMA